MCSYNNRPSYLFNLSEQFDIRIFFFFSENIVARISILFLILLLLLRHSVEGHAFFLSLLRSERVEREREPIREMRTCLRLFRSKGAASAAAAAAAASTAKCQQLYSLPQSSPDLRRRPNDS